MNKGKAIAEANALWEKKCICELRAQATRAVPGEGNADAEIVLIGEAPGKNEDMEGRPFVGAAGKFLSEMLDTVALRREDIYITNIVKYRPPNNRDPLPEEIEACDGWLTAQLNIIRPLIIVTLGRHALEHFIPGKKISQVHGQAFRRVTSDGNKQVFFALYHPAAALYNGGMRETLVADFKKLPLLLKRLRAERFT